MARGKADPPVAPAGEADASPAAAPVGERRPLERALLAVGRWIAREPVVWIAAAGLWIVAVFRIDPVSLEGIALTATITAAQKSSTRSKVAAREDVEVARWVGAAEEAARASQAPGSGTRR